MCGGACRAFIPGAGPRRAESGGVGDSGPGSSRVWEQILADGGEAQQLTCARGSGSQTRGQFKSVMTDLAIPIHLNAADYHNNTRELGTGGTNTSTSTPVWERSILGAYIYLFMLQHLTRCPFTICP